MHAAAQPDFGKHAADLRRLSTREAGCLISGQSTCRTGTFSRLACRADREMHWPYTNIVIMLAVVTANGREPLDYHRTARRPAWLLLPEAVRSAICGEVGEVVDVVVAGSGFTPAFAGTVTNALGERFFVKAADTATEFGRANIREADVLAALPAHLPVPTLRWSQVMAGWSVLCLSVVDGRMPGQPWTAADLDVVLDAQAVIADALADPSAALRAAANERSFAEHSDLYLNTWRRVQANTAPNPGPAWVAGHEADLTALESALPVATGDDRGLMHFDLRPDNTLISK